VKLLKTDRQTNAGQNITPLAEAVTYRCCYKYNILWAQSAPVDRVKGANLTVRYDC